LIDPAYQIDVTLRRRLGLVVHRRARHIQQLALAGGGQPVVAVDHGPSLRVQVREPAI